MDNEKWIEDRMKEAGAYKDLRGVDPYFEDEAEQRHVTQSEKSADETDELTPEQQALADAIDIEIEARGGVDSLMPGDLERIESKATKQVSPVSKAAQAGQSGQPVPALTVESVAGELWKIQHSADPFSDANTKRREELHEILNKLDPQVSIDNIQTDLSDLHRGGY